MNKLSDEYLIEHLDQDPAYLDEIIDRYQGRIWVYTRRLCQLDDEEVEEILQDIFVAIWKNFKSFDTTLKASSWIYRIAHNTTISRFRSWKSRGNENRVHDESVWEVIPGGTDLEKELDQKLDSKIVQNVLQMLPEKYKEVLVLRFIEDFSYDEISDILKKNPNTIATLIARAKKKFLAVYQSNAPK